MKKFYVLFCLSLGFALFVMFRGDAVTFRGNSALGGEVFLIAWPLLVYALYDTAKKMLWRK